MRIRLWGQIGDLGGVLLRDVADDTGRHSMRLWGTPTYHAKPVSAHRAFFELHQILRFLTAIGACKA